MAYYAMASLHLNGSDYVRGDLISDEDIPQTKIRSMLDKGLIGYDNSSAILRDRNVQCVDTHLPSALSVYDVDPNGSNVLAMRLFEAPSHFDNWPILPSLGNTSYPTRTRLVGGNKLLLQYNSSTANQQGTFLYFLDVFTGETSRVQLGSLTGQISQVLQLSDGGYLVCKPAAPYYYRFDSNGNPVGGFTAPSTGGAPAYVFEQHGTGQIVVFRGNAKYRFDPNTGALDGTFTSTWTDAVSAVIQRSDGSFVGNLDVGAGMACWGVNGALVFYDWGSFTLGYAMALDSTGMRVLVTRDAFGTPTLLDPDNSFNAVPGFSAQGTGISAVWSRSGGGWVAWDATNKKFCLLDSAGQITASLTVPSSWTGGNATLGVEVASGVAFFHTNVQQSIGIDFNNLPTLGNGTGTIRVMMPKDAEGMFRFLSGTGVVNGYAPTASIMTWGGTQYLTNYVGLVLYVSNNGISTLG